MDHDEDAVPDRILIPMDPSPRETQAALADLGFIRSTMEQASAFTAVPGYGGVAMGLVAVTAAVRHGQMQAEGAAPAEWVRLWLVAAVVATLLGVGAIAFKLRGAGLIRGAGRRFALAFVPAIAAGVAFSWALWRAGQPTLLPGTWLLLYGVGVTAAGTHSVRVVPAMGLGFITFGILALTTSLPAPWLLAAGFGGLHLIGGAVIARRHGG